MSRFHARTLELLSPRPAPSEQGADAVRQCEHALGITLPASVREWYELDGAIELLRKYSNEDHPLDLSSLGMTVLNGRRTPREMSHADGLLSFMYENQGVCTWAVQLDSGDDPPVRVGFDAVRREEWMPLAASFSDFIYCQVWDWTRWRFNCEAQDEIISVETLEHLRRTFVSEPTTTGWPGSGNYRFTTPWGRILIWNTDLHGADWFLRANSEEHLAKLINSVWHCGTLSETLHGHDPVSEQLLHILRHQNH